MYAELNHKIKRRAYLGLNQSSLTSFPTACPTSHITLPQPHCTLLLEHTGCVLTSGLCTGFSLSLGCSSPLSAHLPVICHLLGAPLKGRLPVAVFPPQDPIWKIPHTPLLIPPPASPSPPFPLCFSPQYLGLSDRMYISSVVCLLSVFPGLFTSTVLSLKQRLANWEGT